jgi:hypothetical protein
MHIGKSRRKGRRFGPYPGKVDELAQLIALAAVTTQTYL